MKSSVLFCFCPEIRWDIRRISVKIEGYPFKPSIGDKVQLPYFDGGHDAFYGVVTSVSHDPTCCYVPDMGCEIVCMVDVNKSDFEVFWKFMKAKGPLINQWSNWSIFEV
jgi:hypothetical protein